MVYVEQFAVVGIQVRTHLRVYARRTLAFFACRFVIARHAVHVCRGTADIAEIAFEVGLFNYLLYLAHNTFF